MRRSVKSAFFSSLAALVVSLGVALAPAPARADYLGFEDVSPNDWSAEQGYLDYVTSEGLMSGLSETSFGPTEPLSRAQVATVLWRVAGEPEPDAGVERFPDCDYSGGSFYGRAVSWARETGVVTGYEDGRFGPADPVTREQLATMLARYAGGVAGLDASSDGSALAAMADASSVTLWDGMAWAVDAGVLTGDMSTGEPLALPRASAQRDQAAKMFSVFHRDVLGEGDGDLELPEGVGLSDGVTLVPADEYDMTGELSATLDGTAADVGVGDVIVLSPTEENPGGAAIRVTSVSESAGGTRVSGVTPELDEVVDELDVSGTTTELVSVDLAEGVELVDARTGAAVPMFEGSLDLVDKSFKIKGIGTIGIESSLDYDIDYSWGRFKTLALTLNAEADFDTSLTATTGDRAVRIGTLSFKTGVPGLTVDLDLYFTYSASGGMELWATASASAGFRYEDGKWSSHADKDFAYGVSLSGQVKAGIEPALVLELLSIDIVDASVELGGVVDGLTQVRQSGMVCNDLSAWMYVDLAIGQHGSVADDLGLSKVFHIVTEKNSPRWDQHTENGELVPVCTWDPGADEEPDDAEPAHDFECEYFYLDVPDDWVLSGGDRPVPGGPTLWSAEDHGGGEYYFVQSSAFSAGDYVEYETGACTVLVGGSAPGAVYFGMTSGGVSVYVAEASAGFLYHGYDFQDPSECAVMTLK